MKKASFQPDVAMKGNLPLTRDNAVIGWTLGKNVVSKRWNYEHFPVCTVELPTKILPAAHPATKPLGLWGI